MASDAEFGVRWQNLRDPARYRTAVEEAGQAVEEHERRSQNQAMGEYCWLGLRQSRGISTLEFIELFGVSLEETYIHLDDLIAEGLLEQQGDRLALSRRGVLLADSVFSTFF